MVEGGRGGASGGREEEGMSGSDRETESFERVLWSDETSEQSGSEDAEGDDESRSAGEGPSSESGETSSDNDDGEEPLPGVKASTEKNASARGSRRMGAGGDPFPSPFPVSSLDRRTKVSALLAMLPHK